MPQVPVYDQQVQAQAPQFETGQVLPPPQAAFGGDVAQAMGKLGGSISEAGNVLAQHAIEVNRMKTEQQAYDGATSVGSKLQNLMFNSSGTDDQGNPKPGLLNRQGAAATGSTEEFDQAYQQLKAQALDQIGSPEGKQMLNRLLDRSYMPMRERVIQNESKQQRQGYNDSVDSYLKQSVANAGALTDPALMNDAINQANEVQDKSLPQMGAQPGDIQLSKQGQAKQMVQAAFGPLLTQDAGKAQALLEGVKSQLSPTDYAHLQSQLDGKQLEDTMHSVWNRVQGDSFQLPDGTSDREKISNYVASLGLPPEKEDKVRGYVLARAGEQDQENQQQAAADQYKFTNQVLQIQKQGGTLDDALKLIPQYADDNSSQADFQKLAVRIFSKPDVKTDPVKFVELWNGLHDKTLNSADVTQAYQRDQLSGSDFRNLMETNYNVAHKDDEFYQKETVDRIKELAEAQFGQGNKQAQAQYLYSVLSASRGKSPEETWKTANDLLKGDPNTGIKGWIQTDQWKTDLSNRDATNLMWGQLHSDVGQAQVRAIGKGVLSTGKKSWGPSDVQRFADSFGGYDQIKKGTPVNNAINSLIQNRKLVTPGTVKRVLKTYPDGVIKE